MSSDPQAIYHLALRDILAEAGGHFVTRNGWSLPNDYGDVQAEYRAIREAAAMLERSNRSRFMVTGTDAGVVLARVFAGHPDELEEGRAMRALALDESGQIRDVALLARTGAIAYLVSGEPGQRNETFGRLDAAKEADFDVEIGDRTTTTCLLGINGPRAAAVAREHLAEALPGNMPPMHCVALLFHGFRTLALRTSDTGEDGFELMLAPAVAQHAIETLRAAGILLAGGEAQEIARVEACIPAFDPDLTPGLSPAQADLDALLDVPGGRADRLLSALILDSPAPVPVGTALFIKGQPAGEIRSCVHSPSLNATIALGIINATLANPGQSLEVAGRAATVIAKPFLRRRPTQ